MRPDHAATDIVPHQSLLASPFEDLDDEGESPRQTGAFSRITFCFAWLFGLEPFLSGAVTDATRSGAQPR